MDNFENPMAETKPAQDVINNVNKKIQSNPFAKVYSDTQEVLNELSNVIFNIENLLDVINPDLIFKNISEKSKSSENNSDISQVKINLPDNTAAAKPSYTGLADLVLKTSNINPTYYNNLEEIFSSNEPSQSAILNILNNSNGIQTVQNVQNLSSLEKLTPIFNNVITKNFEGSIKKLLDGEIQSALNTGFIETQIANAQPATSTVQEPTNIVNNNQTYQTYNNYYSSNSDLSELFSSWDNITSG